ncbi:ATP synthase subunit b, mitochondrial [Bombyx mori]
MFSQSSLVIIKLLWSKLSKFLTMIFRPFIQPRFNKQFLFVPNFILAHTSTCPASKPKCGASAGKGGTTSIKKIDFKRAEKSAPCRFGFIPEEWFQFFHSKTGVTGPYIFGLVFVNYLVSKEIYVLEHEYYSGLSYVVILYFISKKMAPGIGASLDKEVDAEIAEWEKGRADQMKVFETTIKDAKDAQWRAEGQKILIEAKKENVAMQLEAVYRERAMRLYQMVKGRLDYHVKKRRTENKLHQKWMIAWILENVHKSITADFQKQALNQAIKDLALAASRVK